MLAGKNDGIRNTVLLEASIYTRADVRISLAVLRHPRV